MYQLTYATLSFSQDGGWYYELHTDTYLNKQTADIYCIKRIRDGAKHVALRPL